MQLVAVLKSIAVEPGPVINANRIHDERVSFPVSNGMSHEGGVLLDVFRMFGSVGVNQPVNKVIFKQDRHSAGILHDLKRRRSSQRSRWTRRKAKAVRVK